MDSVKVYFCYLVVYYLTVTSFNCDFTYEIDRADFERLCILRNQYGEVAINTYCDP